MGYFGQQIYNEPMSTYVDPKLDILANSLQAVQKRHDDNYAQMSALDIMAHNTKVAEGDKGIKDAALGRLKTQRDAIAASGDYAYAAPRIGMAVKDWSTDDNLVAAKDNQAAIEEHDKQRQEMRAAGHIDLDFNPADNWTTIDPATGKTRRFTSKLEKQLDTDARAQEVSKLLENTQNLGLSAANVQDFLQHGSITGISDARVKANLENAITRFMVSPEGDQMKRKLTQIDKLTPEQADAKISDYLLTVGRAQVHQKVNMDYQVNTPALERAKMAADEAKARAKASGTEGGVTLSPATNLLTNAAKPGGTAVGDDVIKKFFPTTKIKDASGNEYEGMVAQNAILDYGKLFKPESGNFSSKEVEDAQRYFAAENKFNKLDKAYATQIKNLTGIHDFKTAMSKIGVGSPQFNPKTLEKANKLVADYNAAKAELNSVRHLSGKAKKYASALQGDNAELAESIGTKISNANLPFNTRQGENNFEIVDGKFNVKAQSKLTEKELEAKFNSNEISYMKDKGMLTVDNSGDNYTLNFNTRQPISEINLENYDTGIIPAGMAYEHSGLLGATRAKAIKKLTDLGDLDRNLDANLVNVPADKKLTARGNISKEMDQALLQKVDYIKSGGQTLTQAQKDATNQLHNKMKRILNNYDNASHQERRELQEYLQELNEL